MPRPNFILDPSSYYHITCRTHNRQGFNAPMDFVWESAENHLYFLNKSFEFEILCFVLMINHYHLIARSPSLSSGMQYFNKSISDDLKRQTGNINQLWGGRFWRTRLPGYWHIQNTYKYAYRNPVKAGICDFVEDYQYSTLHGLLGKSRILIPVTCDLNLFENDFESTLAWLNTAPTTEALQSIKSALKKPSFILPKMGQKKSPWEESPI